VSNVQTGLAKQPNLRSMLSMDEVHRRPSRPPDYEAESKALIALAKSMAESPENILQKLADTTLTLCRAHSAGLSLLEDADHKSNFHWRAIAGQWTPHLNGGTPRNFGPCGTVLDQNVAMVCSRPELDFPYWAPIKPVLEEGLLIPFYIKGEAIGTIWVVAHDLSRRFDAEDLRLVTNLGAFAAAAYQTLLSLNEIGRMASIVESTDDAILSTDLYGIITTWNRGAESVFGYSAEEAIGKPVTILIPPDRHNEEVKILERIRCGERVDPYDAVRQRKDGSLADISLTISPVKDTTGKVVGASKIARDISEKKQAQARQELLTREVQHRTKNLFAVVLAIVGRSFAGKLTVKDAEAAVVSRLQSLAQTHELLFDRQWQGADLVEVVQSEVGPYGDRVHINGPNLILTAKAAQNFALAVHELATNAAKYGALSNATGRVEISWSSMVSNGSNIFSFRWHELFGPPVLPPTQKGFGSAVLEQVMADHFEVSPRIDFAAAGIKYELSGPLDALTTD
jgi:PAS domain S-box-containing protein